MLLLKLVFLHGDQSVCQNCSNGLSFQPATEWWQQSGNKTHKQVLILQIFGLAAGWG